jgi:phosphoribosylaminoimidazole-succinocarboxamide synthase
MAEQHAECRPDRAQDRAENAAEDFAFPLHNDEEYRMALAATDTLFHSSVTGLEMIHRGKVRDIYAIDDAHLLIVTTDRLSAFDVVLPDPIPDKGRVLTQISNFWFGRTAPIVPNQLATLPLAEVIRAPAELAALRERAVVVRRLKALPIEAVVRGYLIGSGWKDYQSTGAVCGIALPKRLRMADRLPAPIFTPATKAPSGQHDENISFAATAELLDESVATQVRDTAIALYRFAADYALTRGIIIADTKFEFGQDAAGRLVLIDEALTPDSSRFWPAATWRPGSSPPSFDKQFVRDYLETLDWNKKAPGPRLPPEIIRKTSEKYREALNRLTS